jgi:hypothetical protein
MGMKFYSFMIISFCSSQLVTLADDNIKPLGDRKSSNSNTDIDSTSTPKLTYNIGDTDISVAHSKVM